MMRTTVALGTLLVPSLALAEPPVQLGVGIGYSQGVGELGGYDTAMQEVAGPGGSVQLEATGRVAPQLSLGFYGTVAQYQRGDLADGDIAIRGATAGMLVTYRVDESRSSPWMSFGAGWRGMWLDPDTVGTTRAFHGIELARLQVGTDVATSSRVAVAPVIGVSLSTFLTQRVDMTLVGIEDHHLQVTGFAGVSGRFAL